MNAVTGHAGWMKRKQHWLGKLLEHPKRLPSNLSQLICVRSTAMAVPGQRIFPRDDASVKSVALRQTDQLWCAKLRKESQIVTELGSSQKATGIGIGSLLRYTPWGLLREANFCP